MTRVDVVAVTHRGRERRHNEDTVAVAGYQSGVLEGRPVRFAVDTLLPVTCLVADGLGGHAEGGRASRLAAAVIGDAAPGLRDSEAVVRAVRAANDAVYEEMAYTPRWSAMGATVVVLVLVDGSAICVNVGDSRCFLQRAGSLVQLSADDSPAPAAGETAEPAVVTQTLGGWPAPAAVEPHVHRTPVEPGDQFLLCSDGLTDMVPLDRIEKEMAAAPDEVAGVEALLRAALDAGGRDNISIVLATVGGAPAEPPGAAAVAPPAEPPPSSSPPPSPLLPPSSSPPPSPLLPPSSSPSPSPSSLPAPAPSPAAPSSSPLPASAPSPAPPAKARWWSPRGGRSGRSDA
jgi:serine/threonine protein phosphatase PrpC